MSGSIDFSGNNTAIASVTPATFPVPSSNGFTPITMVGWVKRAQQSVARGTMGVFTIEESANNYIAACVEGRDALSDRFRTSARAAGGSLLTGNGAFHTDNTWDYFIHDCASITARVMYSSGGSGSNVTSCSPTGINQIAFGKAAAYTNGYDALASQFMLFTGTLTEAQRTAVANKQNAYEIEAVSGGTAVLVGYWPGDVADGYLQDVVGGNHALLANDAAWAADDPGVNAIEGDPVLYVPQMSPLYYGQALLADKTNIWWQVQTSIGGAVSGSGATASTDGFGVPSIPASEDYGVLNDEVCVSLYWEEGTEPVVDRSLIVKTTLVEDV